MPGAMVSAVLGRVPRGRRIRSDRKLSKYKDRGSRQGHLYGVAVFPVVLSWNIVLVPELFPSSL